MTITAMEPPAKAFWSFAELAERWGVKKKTVEREATRGRLRPVYVGAAARVRSDEVERYERERVSARRRRGAIDSGPSGVDVSEAQTPTTDQAPEPTEAAEPDADQILVGGRLINRSVVDRFRASRERRQRAAEACPATQ
jgi:hypothetical protein